MSGWNHDTARVLADIVARGKARHGEQFDPSKLAPQFLRYYRTDTRLRVRGPWGERTGTVGKTTGWRPAFLLMHRSSDHGSSDVLSEHDEIVAVKFAGARTYRPLHPSEVTP